MIATACLALSAYFVHHTFHGRYGLGAKAKLSAEVTALDEEINLMASKKHRLQRDVSLLGGAPHPDLVEELAQSVLGYAYPNARIVPAKALGNR